MRSLHRITFSRKRSNLRSARADFRGAFERSVATRNQPMIFFGMISRPALAGVSISIAPGLPLQFALGYRGYFSPRLALQ